MDAVANILKYELHRLLVDGIKYERIGGDGPESEWEMMLFKNEELINYLTALQVTALGLRVCGLRLGSRAGIRRSSTNEKTSSSFVKLPSLVRDRHSRRQIQSRLGHPEA